MTLRTGHGPNPAVQSLVGGWLVELVVVSEFITIWMAVAIQKLISKVCLVPANVMNMRWAIEKAVQGNYPQFFSMMAALLLPPTPFTDNYDATAALNLIIHWKLRFLQFALGKFTFATTRAKYAKVSISGGGGSERLSRAFTPSSADLNLWQVELIKFAKTIIRNSCKLIFLAIRSAPTSSQIVTVVAVVVVPGKNSCRSRRRLPDLLGSSRQCAAP